MKDLNEILQQLRQPFRPEDISWLPGTTKGDKCMAMAYADLRAYMDALDSVCGADWQAVYTPWGERLICNLTICGVTRSSTGEMDAANIKSGIGGTVAEAQAFKRACAMFGLGRYLYDLPAAWVAFDAQSKRISKAGQDELDSRYRKWYAKEVAQPTPRKVDTSTGEIHPEEDFGMGQEKPVEGATPYYVHAYRNLTGKAYDLVKWAASLHLDGGPASAAQYQYLTGVIDKLTGDQHNYTLSVLCQSDISSSNMPSSKISSALLKLLAKEEKDEKGILRPSKHYREDIAELVTEIAKAAQPELLTA